ncbi:MAG: hypothetical protein IJT82_01205, partial [Schwartzia sp.]|nr:hypothetical protein [Schwartzia sp. (in: firmicutes)]
MDKVKERLIFVKKYLKYIIPGIMLAVFLLLEFYSRSAALIFNEAMKQQDMLRGIITAEKITANIGGNVSFENLEWKAPNGDLILMIPDGNFKVSIWDIITKNFSSTTVSSLALNNAKVSIHLNDDMSWDFVKNSKALNAVPKEKNPDVEWEKNFSLNEKSEEEIEKILARRRKLKQQEIEKNWHNFNLEGHKLKLHLKFNNCRMEIFYRERHYLLSNVRLHTDVNTDDAMKIKASTGRFGGTMIGNGLSVNGSIDFKPSVPECRISVTINEVDPSSLGLGADIHDKITLHANISGAISHPIGKGTLHMDELHIPALNFTDVDGKIDYDDSVLKFTDVTAKVYGGSLRAEGWYDLDSRHYQIYGHGKDLKTRHAFPGQHLNCAVKLNVNIDSKGSVKTTTYSGDFLSGEGHYN